jgi:hypothetical protein
MIVQSKANSQKTTWLQMKSDPSQQQATIWVQREAMLLTYYGIQEVANMSVQSPLTA